ncbi:MAG: ribonuclease Y [Calditrichaeota bacterium]|nr:MAG: ribonuclease Y [Calditrichota bacterium]
MDAMVIGLLIGALILGVFIGIATARVFQKMKEKNARQTAEEIIRRAERSAEKLEREAYIRAKEKFQQERLQIQKQLKHREGEISRQEERLRRKEKDLRRAENNLRDRESLLNKQRKQLEELQKKVESREKQVEDIIEQQMKKLESLSGLNREEAKRQLKEHLLHQARSEAAQMILDIKREAEERARWEAKEIMAYAMERMATEYTMESTLASVSLPNDNWKGLIIGREGRNIKAFEAATGVKVIVDDTPETVVMSSFDPVKREIARLTMEALIKKKNINPRTIEKEVKRAQQIVEESVKQAAEETLRDLKINNVHPEMKNYLGRLKYRTSYGQNILQHSREVALLAGNMAAELGLDVQLARRAGLFHDIGKAVSSDSEGSHVSIGVEIATRCKEHPVVINSILAHHEEEEPIHPISVLVTAADRISGARPGARRESLEAYTQRITKLEELANSFAGVAKTYALSAGREIWVMVEPEKLTDEEAELLAGDIARKIKEQMEYPGQIKVCVIRQLIAQSSTEEFLTKNKSEKVAI